MNYICKNIHLTSIACKYQCAFVYHFFVYIHLSIWTDWQLIDAYTCMIVWRKHRERMRHATSSSSEKIRENENRWHLFSFLSSLIFFSSLLACSIIGMCQAAVYVYSLGGLKHDHHLSHTQISSLSPTLDSRTEKNESIRKKKKNRERERERMRGSQEKLSFIYSLTL